MNLHMLPLKIEIETELAADVALVGTLHLKQHAAIDISRSILVSGGVTMIECDFHHEH